MRPQPPPPPSIDDRQGPAVIVQIRHYDLLTPLFGGSARPGEVDEKYPIRGSSIRGQLRFWWRATRGGQYADRAAMKAAEDAIWGSTKTGSRVTVDVTQASAGQLFQATDPQGRTTDRSGWPLTIGHQNSRDSYAAFPLRGNENANEPPGEVRSGVKFQLRLSFDPTVTEDVRAALWAWDTFGGIGARTRRGFGALSCHRVDAVTGAAGGPWQWLYERATADKVLIEDMRRYVSAGTFPAGVPHLSHDMRRYRVIVRAGATNGVAVWRGLIALLREFRQSRPPGGRGAGRSDWPEPDAIRRLTGQPPPPLPPSRAPYYAFNKFPRAAFGLPIIFEFRGERGGPPRTTLQGAHHSRLASPLLLRPLALAGGDFAGLAVVLEGPRVPPGGLVLDGRTGSPSVDSDLDPATGETTAVSRRHPTYNGNPDILQAFLDQL